MRPIAAAPLALALPSLASPNSTPDLESAFSDLLHDAEGGALPDAEASVELGLGGAPRPGAPTAAAAAPGATPDTLLPGAPPLVLLDGEALPVEEVDGALDGWFEEEPALAGAEDGVPPLEEAASAAPEAPIGGALPWLALLAVSLPPVARAPTGGGVAPPASRAPEGREGAPSPGLFAAASPSRSAAPLRPAPADSLAPKADPSPADDPRPAPASPVVPAPASPDASAPPRSVAEPARLPAELRPPVVPAPAQGPSSAAPPALEPAGLALRAEGSAPQAAASRADGPNWSWAVVTQAIRPKASPGPVSPPLAAARASRTWDSTPWFPQGAPPTEVAPPPLDAPIDPAALTEAPPEIALAPGAPLPPAPSPSVAAPALSAAPAPPAPDQAELLDSMLPARISDELDVVVREAEGLVRVHLSAHNQSMSVHLRAPEALVGGFQALAPELDAALGEAGYSLDSFEAEADGGEARPERDAEPEPQRPARPQAEASAAGRDSSVHRVV